VPSIVVGEQGAAGLDELRGWLRSGEGTGAPIIESLDLARNVAVATLTSGTGERTSSVGEEAAANLQSAEVGAAQLAHGGTTWLPRLAFEFTRVRSELGERTSQVLAQLEQRHEQWIQSDIAGAIHDLPAVLLEGLRSVSRVSDDELVSRLDAVADQFLGGRSHQFLPGGMKSHLAPPDVDVRLVDVSRMHVDPRTELFAGLGNFGSGRQSLGLVSSLATALSAPMALAGGVIGLGFWRVGRKSRQDGQARLHASRWLKIQIAEAGRVIRYRIDQGLNQGQLVLNLAVRDYYDRAGADARQSVDAARRRVAEAEAIQQQQAQAMTARTARAERLLERSETLHDVAARGSRSGAQHHGLAGGSS
jgi:hypothetical protein